jgi:hypothetical protein
MKSKLTTTFALLGVLAAGTAAAAVNTQALQSRAESTIGAGTTTLITPVADPVVLDVSATPDVIQLDTATTPEVSVPTADPSPSQTPVKKKKAKAKASASATPSATENEGDEGDDDEGEDEDDD